MPTARLIVNEHSSEWAVAWRRILRGSNVPLCQTRSLAHCGQELAASPASVLALELAADNLPALLAALVDWTRRFPLARSIVLGARGTEACDPLVREAGAVHAVFSPQHLASTAVLVKRHLAAAPEPEMTLREAIWSRLPWAAGS